MSQVACLLYALGQDYCSPEHILLLPFFQNVGDNDVNLKRTVEEIKKLQEEVSALRQENIQLKVR